MNSSRQSKYLHHAGEHSHQQFLIYIVLHPTQLLGRVPSLEETGDGIPALAVVDEIEGLLEAIRQIIQRIVHHRMLRQMCILSETPQDRVDSVHARQDASVLLLVPAIRRHCILYRLPDTEDLPRAAQCNTSHLALQLVSKILPEGVYLNRWIVSSITFRF